MPIERVAMAAVLFSFGFALAPHETREAAPAEGALTDERAGCGLETGAMTSNGKSSFARTMKAVLWSFFGVRRRADHEADTQLNPLHLIAAAIIAAAVFIAVLVAVVHMVTS